MREISDQPGLKAHLATGERTAVLFHARWCPFCRSFKPLFAQAAGKLEGFQPIESLLDDVENPLWVSESIRVVPAVLFFAGGREVGRVEATAGLGLSAGQLERAWREAAGRG